MIFLIFLYGIVLASFYIVVGLRLPMGESIFGPRSHCDSCKHVLAWYELIPLISYLIQRGKCRECKKEIPKFYFLIELLTGLLFALCFHLYGLSYEFYAGIIIVSVVIIIYVSDFKYMIILDSPLVISTILILLLKYFYFGGIATAKAMISSFLMFMFLLTIKLVADKVFKREALGGGDVKLSLLTGVVLGIKLGLTSMIISSFLAFPYALFSLKKEEEKEIPFGPFLATGLFIVFIFMEPIVGFISTFLVFT